MTMREVGYRENLDVGDPASLVDVTCAFQCPVRTTCSSGSAPATICPWSWGSVTLWITFGAWLVLPTSTLPRASVGSPSIAISASVTSMPAAFLTRSAL